MKKLIALSILFAPIAWFPALCQTPQGTLETDVATMKTDIATMKTDIATMKTQIAVINTEIKNLNEKFGSLEKTLNGKFESLEKNFNGKFESLEKNFDRQNSILIACIGIPLAILAVGATAWGISASRRIRKDQTLEKQIETLTQEIETLKGQYILRP